MVEARQDTPIWSHGNAAAKIGTREWADFVRLEMVSMATHLGEDAERFAGYIELAREHRAWTLMNKPDGSFFKSIEEFCEFKRPFGLGRAWPEIRRHLEVALLKSGKDRAEVERALQLESVPEARAANQHTAAASPHREGKQVDLSHATAERLRAIATRAPDAVKDAYREGRLSQTLAAKLGPKSPSPEQAAQIAEVAQAIKGVKERSTVETIVREKLGVVKLGPVDRAMGLVRNMSEADVYAFKAKFNEYLKERSGAGE